VYPVGSIYTNSSVSTNPGTLLGFGTWAAFGAGRVMVGFNASDTLFDSAEETGGSKDAIVVSHTHTGTTNTGGLHSHDLMDGSGGDRTNSITEDGGNLSGQDNKTVYRSQTTYPIVKADGAHTHTFTTASTGSSGTNANLPPYITVYLWKRVA
jgi:hypothetical protein